MTGRAEARRRPRLPWVLLGLAVLAVAAGDALRLTQALTSSTPAFGEWLETTVNTVTFGAVGALVARHRPRNAVGWLMLTIGCLSAIQLAAGEYATYGLFAESDPLPVAAVSAGVSQLAVLIILAALIVLILVFPDGRLVSRRWRPWIWLTVTVDGLTIIAVGLRRGTLGNQGEGIENPFGVLPDLKVLDIAAAIGLSLCILAAITSLAVRWRRGEGDQRQQLKWVVFAGVVGPTAIVACTLAFPRLTAGHFGNLLWAFGIGIIPVAAGISILKYRLFDIDRIVSRTVSYAVLTGLLAAVYFGSVAAVTYYVPSHKSLAVAGSTLAVAALLQPVRRRVQARVDRRFNRSRYDSVRTVEAFSQRLREQVDLASVQADMLAVVRSTMQPVAVGLWLRGSGEGVR